MYVTKCMKVPVRCTTVVTRMKLGSKRYAARRKVPNHII